MDWNTFRRMNFTNNTREDAVETKEIKSIEELKMDNVLPEGYVIKKCEHCGQEFAVAEHYAKRTKYCGPKCRKEVGEKQKKEYAQKYYKNVTLKKRQDKRLAEKLATTEEAEKPETVKSVDFYKVASVSLEIMRIVQSDKSNANKLAELMEFVEDLLKK